MSRKKSSLETGTWLSRRLTQSKDDNFQIGPVGLTVATILGCYKFQMRKIAPRGQGGRRILLKMLTTWYPAMWRRTTSFSHILRYKLAVRMENLVRFEFEGRNISFRCRRILRGGAFAMENFKAMLHSKSVSWVLGDWVGVSTPKKEKEREWKRETATEQLSRQLCVCVCLSVCERKRMCVGERKREKI